MTPLSNEILRAWQVRKTGKQKSAFIAFLQSHFPALQVENGGLFKNRNLVLGDPASAKIVFTAHYDTCARLPFPNFITPCNLWPYLGYQLLICLPFLALYFACLYFLPRWGVDFLLSDLIGFAAMMGAMVWLLMLGTPNAHTANDNTSGVITLCELYAALPEEARQQAAFVFFDNEENGLLGSAAFHRRHKKDNIDGKLLLNFDCVSDGDGILLALSKPARARFGALLEECYTSADGKAVLFPASAFYPSDQVNFKLGVGVAALKKHRAWGWYMDKIHTKHDTAFDESNIAFLVSHTEELMKRI